MAAPTAHAEVAAAWRHAVGCGLQHLQSLGLGVPFLDPRETHSRQLAG
jgi:hypothetical protein